MNKVSLCCQSNWNISYVGKLYPEMIFENISDYRKHPFPFSVFLKNLFFHSHEVLYYKEKYHPFIFNIEGDITPFINHTISLVVEDGQGTISLEEENCTRQNSFLYPFISDSVLCSNLEGMMYLKNRNIRRVVIRGEFINTISFNTEQLVNIIDFATSTFPEVIYRLSDLNNNEIIGNRGSYALLSTQENRLGQELNILRHYMNLSILCPFIRNASEAVEIYKRIKGVCKGRVGCMLEVPLLFYESRNFTSLYDFFVIGISDLSQLLQGTDRNISFIHSSTIELIVDLMDYYFLPYVNKKEVYLTSRELYDILKKKYPQNNFIYLSK